MAADTANNIEYIIELPVANRELLGHIRHWEHLKAAQSEDAFYIKGFTRQELHNTDVQGIPYMKVYYVKENLLFAVNKLVPAKKLPSGLLWTPLPRLLPVSLPQLNHNYFGVTGSVPVRLVPWHNETEPYALLANIEMAGAYIESAPKVRLQRLQWIIIDNKALLAGVPLLPLQGQSYWKRDNFLIPTGYDLEFPDLGEVLAKLTDNSANKIILWYMDGSCSILNEHDFQPLSISSFRLTLSSL